jgi:hypothetical protein
LAVSAPSEKAVVLFFIYSYLEEIDDVVEVSIRVIYTHLRGCNDVAVEVDGEEDARCG